MASTRDFMPYGKDMDGRGGDTDRLGPERARLTRRELAVLAGAVPAAVGMPAVGAGGVEAFRRFSAVLTGFSVAELDVEYAQELLRALRSSGRGAAVDALMSGADIADGASLETDILSAWYSGLVQHRNGPVVAAIRDALVWRALGFASAPGGCAAPGSWSEPPVGAQR